MKGVTFPQHNTKLIAPKGHEDEVYTLPAYRTGNRIISCWQPTWREVASILFHRRVWLILWAGETQPPVELLGTATIFADSFDETYTIKRLRLWVAGSVALLAMVAVGIIGPRWCSYDAETPGSQPRAEASVGIVGLPSALVAPDSPQTATGDVPDAGGPGAATDSPGRATESHETAPEPALRPWVPGTMPKQRKGDGDG